MDPLVERDFSKAFKALKAGGLLLESDSQLPCVTRIIVGRRLRNSWWAHPRANLIYDVLNRLYHHREVLTTKLVGGKVTLIHKKLWPAVFAVATSREPWQQKGLSRTAKRLLAEVTKHGMLETNRLPAYQKRSKLIAEAARELERKLLVYAEGYHTSSGAHAKRLETWQGWARRVGLKRVRIKPEQAKTKLEDVLMDLAGSADFKRLLPWNMHQNRLGVARDN